MKNKLYRYLSDMMRGEPGFQFKVSQAGVSYAMFMLKKMTFRLVLSSEMPMLTLDAHHLSFYKDEEDSQYHYTASFSDNKKNVYTCHVYFDRADRMVNGPILSMNRSGDEVQNIGLNVKCKRQLFELASQQASHAMANIRLQYQKELTDLFKLFNTKEMELATLLKNDSMYSDRYYTQLEQLITLVTTIDQYHYHDQFRSILNLLNRLKNHIKAQSAVPQNVYVSELTPETPTPVIDTPAKKPAPALIQPIREFEHSLQEAIASEATFLAIPITEYDKKVTAFLMFHQKCHDANIQIDLDSTSPSAEHLNRLTSLLVSLNKEGITLLQRMLLSAFENKFELAKQLKTYLTYSAENLYTVAVRTANPALLAFLLENHELAVDSTVVHEQLTAIQFFYKQSSMEQKQTAQFFSKQGSVEQKQIDCFKVLIQHGASLMVNAPDNLPIAYRIMSQSKHPLRPAFDQTLEHTLNSPLFYRALKNRLQQLVSADDLDARLRDQLNTAIQTCKANINGITDPANKIDAAQNKNMLELTIRATATISDELMALFAQDSEINGLKEQLLINYSELNALLSTQSARSMKNTSVDIVSNMCQLIEDTGITPSRENVIKVLTDLNIIAGSLIKLYQVQAEITSKRTPGRKQQARLKNEEARLIKEIEPYKKTYGLFLSDYSDIVSKQAEATREIISKSLDELGMFLDRIVRATSNFASLSEFVAHHDAEEPTFLDIPPDIKPGSHHAEMLDGLMDLQENHEDANDDVPTFQP